MNKSCSDIRYRIKCFQRMNNSTIDELIDEMAKAEYLSQIIINSKDKEIENWEKFFYRYEEGYRAAKRDLEKVMRTMCFCGLCSSTTCVKRKGIEECNPVWVPVWKRTE